MSFIRLNKGKAKPPPRKKKPVKLKPWDDTVSDLDAYKATPDEIAYRRESHRSKHAITTHLLKGKLKQGKRSSPLKTNSQARKYAIMKEVLYDQQQLQDVLEKSDTMMAVVKDLFGDDPRRFAGFPTVTSAPNSCDDVERSLVRLPGDIRTRSEVLSDSVMDGSALNEFQDSDSEEDISAVPLVYQPKLNMQRFQQFIEAEEKNNTLSTISGQAGLSHLGPNMSRQRLQGNTQSSQLPEQSGMLSQGDGSFQTPKGNKHSHDESLEMLCPPGSAINDTSKVNKTKRRVPRPEPPEHNTSSNFSLNDLRKVLEILEDEIAEYERVTGRRPPAERQRQETFSGYTLAIVDSVTKLTRYLKESELRLQAEMTVREQLTQDVVQFRALVDALTSDIIFTQEEFGKLADEFQKFRKSTEQEIMKLKGEPIQTMNTAVEDGIQEPVTYTTPPKSQKPQNDIQQNEQQVSAQIPFGDHLQPVNSAVMLSPPVRRTRVNEMDKANENKQGSLMDLPEYLSGVESNNSAVQDEFSDLPGLCPTSNAQILNHINTASQPMMSNKPSQSVSVPNSIPQYKSQIHQKPQSSVPINSVSVPRPTPLVQSNVGIPFKTEQGHSIQTSTHNMPASFLQKNQPISVSTHRDQVCQQFVVDDQGLLSHRSQDSTDREYLTSQIAALNRQHEEAQKRLQGLMLQKEMAAQMQQQQHVAQQVQPEQGESQNGPRDQIGSQTQGPQGQLKQQLQYMQQQRLIALVQQQQQRIQEQQQQQQMQGQISQQEQQPASQRPKPNIPEQFVNGNHVEGAELRNSHDIPGQRGPPKQVGLPDYPVSPNISPISRRSENMADVYRSIESQENSVTVPASRGIMVSLPKVDMDMSGGSPSQGP